MHMTGTKTERLSTEQPATQRRAWLAAGAMTVLGLAATAVQAQPHYDDRRPPGHRPPPPPPQRPGHRPPPSGHRPPPPPPQHGRPNYGTGPNRGWHRGDRLPLQYRSRQYVVSDWRLHRLEPPPRGYHWVQYGTDYMLVAIATGVILQVVLSPY